MKSQFALPRVIGHRGAKASAPENTIASIERARALGATWVELDVMLSGDDVPILMHDENLLRTTGRKARVADVSYAELSALDVGGWFDESFAGEAVPSLEAALGALARLDLGVNIELKPSRGHDAVTAAVTVQLLERLWPKRDPRLLVSSFSRSALAEARRLAPEIPRGLLAVACPRDWRRAAESLGCVSVHLSHDRLTHSQAREIKEAGYLLACFTVNDTARALELLSWGVDSIITDAPDEILAALA